MISVTQSKPSHGTTKSTIFAVSKDKWNKGEHWYIHENVIVHTSVCTEAMPNSKKKISP